MNKVFVYGIFTDQATRIRAFGYDIKTYPAILKGYELGMHSNGSFYSIIKNSKRHVNSIVMEVSDEQLNRLDQIEHINTGMYRRITVNTSIGECFVYLE